MIDINKIDLFKDGFLDVLKSDCQCSIDMDDLYFEKNYSIKGSLEMAHKNLILAIDFFKEAKDIGNLLDVSAALISVRVHMSHIDGVFDMSIKDMDLYVVDSVGCMLPENYQIPKHYNYPLE